MTNGKIGFLKSQLVVIMKRKAAEKNLICQEDLK